MFKRLLSLSLRTHLLLMAFLLTVPAVALIINTGLEQSEHSREEGIEEARRLVYTIATEQYNLTGNSEQLLTFVALLPDVRKRNVAAVNSMLSRILQNTPQYGNIVIMDEMGHVWGSGLPLSRSFSLRDRRTFRNAAMTKRFSSGEYTVGVLSGLPTVGYGYPILGRNGKVEGAISVNLDFAHLDELLRRSGLPKGSSYTIIDHAGTIVTRNRDPGKFIGTKVNEAIFTRMKSGPEEETFFGTGIDGERSINAYRRLQLPHETTPYLYIHASVPLQETQANAVRALVLNILLLTTFLLLTLLLAIRIGDYCFISRIGKLQEASRRLAEGDLQVRVADAVGGGEIGALAATFDDMAQKLASRESALLRSERELSELNRNLAKKIEEETERRLKQERILARQARLAAMGEMIGAIAHQWRQPLATIGAIIQSIRMAWERNRIDEEFLKRAEDDARKQLVYMSDTIEDFRGFFKPEKAEESFDVMEKVAEVAMLVSPRFAHSTVRLEVHRPDAAGLRVRGFQNEFKQSLLNLISNSFDAVTDGGNGEGAVTVSVKREGAQVVIDVRDNGCGIPEEFADKVFDPYFTSKSEGKGTGVGLYMSKLIVEESMGGELTFTSSPGATVFRISLPLEEKAQGAAID